MVIFYSYFFASWWCFHYEFHILKIACNFSLVTTPLQLWRKGMSRFNPISKYSTCVPTCNRPCCKRACPNVSVFNRINKHARNRRRLASVGNFTWQMMVQHFMFTSQYMHRSIAKASLSMPLPRWNPASLIAASSRLRNYATEKRSIWTVKSRSLRSLAFISILPIFQ